MTTRFVVRRVCVVLVRAHGFQGYYLEMGYLVLARARAFQGRFLATGCPVRAQVQKARAGPFVPARDRVGVLPFNSPPPKI